MYKRVILISAALMLSACGGAPSASEVVNDEKTAPHSHGKNKQAEGADHSHRRAHEGRDPKARAERFKAAAKTLGVSEERLKEVLRASRDKPRNWDEIGTELGVEGDALRAALGRPKHLQE